MWDQVMKYGEYYLFVYKVPQGVHDDSLLTNSSKSFYYIKHWIVLLCPSKYLFTPTLFNRPNSTTYQLDTYLPTVTIFNYPIL